MVWQWKNKLRPGARRGRKFTTEKFKDTFKDSYAPFVTDVRALHARCAERVFQIYAQFNFHVVYIYFTGNLRVNNMYKVRAICL